MSSLKTGNNLEQFEKRISSAIISLLAVFFITTVLFAIISYQSYIQQKTLKSKDIDTAISLFQNNLSEKLSIIASSNVFIDFYTSGSFTREDLEPRFLTELLPLRSSGIIGYSLINNGTQTNYQSGSKTDHSLTLKLCYMANRLDGENGYCHGVLKLYFSSDNIIKELHRINSSINSCRHCSQYSLTKNGYFGNFLVEDESQFNVNITSHVKHDNTLYYYTSIIFILFIFALFNREKLRKTIKESISHPIDLLVQKIKSQEQLTENHDALYEINYLSSQIEAGRLKISKMNEYEKQAAMGHLAAGVAHDIRSPLAVMEITMSNLTSIIPSDQLTILSRAIQSVRDIANNLLEQHRSIIKPALHLDNAKPFNNTQDDGNIVRSFLLSTLLESITSQKRYEWQKNPCNFDFQVNSAARSKWVNAAPNDIKRIVSNLLNNAYESLGSVRNISVLLDHVSTQFTLVIIDSGTGIPANKISEVLCGLSLKHLGKGFGLSNAKKYLDSIGGALELSSSAVNGTTVRISFFSHLNPIWLPSEIAVSKNSIVVILDDDASMHNLWRHRLQSNSLSTLHFLTSTSLFEWHRMHSHSYNKIVYLIDFELRGDASNGLDVLAKINPNKCSYLITSHADEIIIQNECKQLGVWLIPKDLSGEIPIVIFD